eukprot:3485349-Prymnesium_polylepis.2
MLGSRRRTSVALRRELTSSTRDWPPSARRKRSGSSIRCARDLPHRERDGRSWPHGRRASAWCWRCVDAAAAGFDGGGAHDLAARRARDRLYATQLNARRNRRSRARPASP